MFCPVCSLPIPVEHDERFGESHIYAAELSIGRIGPFTICRQCFQAIEEASDDDRAELVDSVTAEPAAWVKAMKKLVKSYSYN